MSVTVGATVIRDLCIGRSSPYFNFKATRTASASNVEMTREGIIPLVYPREILLRNFKSEPPGAVCLWLASHIDNKIPASYPGSMTAGLCVHSYGLHVIPHFHCTIVCSTFLISGAMYLMAKRTSDGMRRTLPLECMAKNFFSGLRKARSYSNAPAT